MDKENLRTRIEQEREKQKSARYHAARLSIEAAASAESAHQDELNLQREQLAKERKHNIFIREQAAQVRTLVSMILPELDINRASLFESTDSGFLGRMLKNHDFRGWIVREPSESEEYVTGSYYNPDGPAGSPRTGNLYSTYHTGGVLLSTDGALIDYSGGKRKSGGTNFQYRSGSYSRGISVDPTPMDDSAIYERACNWVSIEPDDVSDIRVKAWEDKLLRLPLRI
jgi:hypothetical protein